MSFKDEFAKIVGAENVFDDPDILESYSMDFSLTKPGRAGLAVYPEETDQVRDIVMMCNKHSLPIVPCSSRVHFRGSTIPKQGGESIRVKNIEILTVSTLDKALELLF